MADPNQAQLAALLSLLASQQNKPAAAPPVGAPPTGIPSIPPPSASGQLDLNALGTSSGFGAEPPATSSRYNEPYGDRREPDYYRQRDRDERYPPPRSRYEEDRYTRDEPRDWERDRDRDYYRDRERDYERRGEPRRGPSGGGRYRERSISPPGRRQYSPGAKDYEDTMPIETQHVGMVIGRGGETLRRIERETGARIQFTPESQSRPGFRIANMVGTVSEVTAARASIKRLVEQSVAQKGSRKDGPGGNIIRQKELPPGTSKFTFTVPDKTVGLIIGRGGDSINEIQEKSGSRVNIVPASQSVNGRRPVNLFGSDEQNAKAKELIEAIVRQDEMGMKKNLAAAEESLSRPNYDQSSGPGRSAPPVTGSNAYYPVPQGQTPQQPTSSQYGTYQNPFQYLQPAGPGATTSSNDAAAQAWAAYYAQQQQAQQQQPSSSGYPQYSDGGS